VEKFSLLFESASDFVRPFVAIAARRIIANNLN
jgi:hypothetical protein